MASRGSASVKRENILWIFIAFVLFWVESRSIYRQQAEQNQEQAQNSQKQREIAQLQWQNGLMMEHQLGELERLNSKMAVSLQKQDSLANAAMRGINTTTGGNSLCFMDLQGPAPYNHPVFYNIGRYPLYEVRARIVDISVLNPNGDQFLAAGRMPFPELSIYVGNLGAASSHFDISMKLPFDPSHGNFNIQFSARNGSWMENFRSRKNNTPARRRAIRIVTEGGPTKVLFQRVDKEYPRDASGKPAW